MQNDYEELFRQAKELIKDELSSIAYDTWILPLKLISFEDDRITIKSNTDYNADFLGKRYGNLIINTFKYLTNKERALTIIYNDEKTNMEVKDDILPQKPEDEEMEKEIELSNKYLNPKYTFDSLVVGNNNRFAQAAALAVADKPSEAYNPLFLYGGVGLGKTHLMHAVGNRILKNFRNFKVLYVTSEKFTNQMINAIKDNKMEVFRNQYRKIDVLLIDDIQFIESKIKSMENLQYTFDSLYNKGKQIVITSDRLPKEIPTLTAALCSRFEMGLMVELTPPDSETRFEIVKKLANDNGLVYEEEALEYIAKNFSNNVRELEGAFTRAMAYSEITEQNLTLQLAREVLKCSSNIEDTDFDKIIDITANYFGVKPDDIKGTARGQKVSTARHVAIYLSRDITNQSFVSIAKAFGKKHTTIMFAYEKIKKETGVKPEITSAIREIRQALKVI